MGIFYKKWKKYNEIQLTNNKMGLKNLKMKNHPPSAEMSYNCNDKYYRNVLLI